MDLRGKRQRKRMGGREGTRRQRGRKKKGKGRVRRGGGGEVVQIPAPYSCKCPCKQINDVCPTLAAH